MTVYFIKCIDKVSISSSIHMILECRHFVKTIQNNLVLTWVSNQCQHNCCEKNGFLVLTQLVMTVGLWLVETLCGLNNNGWKCSALSFMTCWLLGKGGYWEIWLKCFLALLLITVILYVTNTSQIIIHASLCS